MRNFKKVWEDFVCEHCGVKTVGDGYTDHCPRCLWGKHVDEEIPGDRESDCRGLMEPTRVIYERDNYKIIYRCMKCNHEFTVRSGAGDDREELLKLVNN